jgi:HEAT repeat protein
MTRLAAALLVLLPLAARPCDGDEPGTEAGGKPLSAWIKQLREGNEAEWHRAAQVLVAMEAKAEPALLALLEDPSPVVRERATRTLGSTPTMSLAGIAAIVRRLGDEAPPVRRASLAILARWGGDVFAPGFSPRPVFADPGDPAPPDPSVVLAALLETGTAAVPVLEEAVLGEVGPEVRLAAHAFRHLGGDAAAKGVAALAARLEAPLVEARERAVEALGEIGPAASPAVPRLVPLLRSDPEPALRLGVAVALGRIRDPEAVPALLEAMRGEDTKLRALAVEALGGIGVRASEAVPDLVAALADDAWEERRRSRHASPLDTRAEYVVNPVVDALGRIGSPAVGPLVESLRAGKAATRRRAASALAAVSPATARPVGALVLALEDVEPEVRAEAARALATVGPRAREAATALVKAMGDSAWEVRRHAANALGALGPDVASVSVPALEKALRDADRDVARSVSNALASLGEPAVLALLQALTDDSIESVDPMSMEGEVENPAVDGLAWMGPVAVPALVYALAAPGPKVRARAARALASMGARAAPALPALVKAAKDPDESVRHEATEAIRRIAPR